MCARTCACRSYLRRIRSNGTVPMNPKELTVAKLRESLIYEPATGIFRRRKTKMVAGCLKPATGYRYVRVCGIQHLAHRLAWLYMTGEWPDQQVDHRDCNRANNRWSNLRSASSSQNKMNSSTRCDNALGHRGINRTSSGNFRVRVVAQGRTFHDRVYATLSDAVSARSIAARFAHKEFARLQ